jgi:hypothetical protein
VTGFVGGVLTGTVVCTSCGEIPGAEARGYSMSPDPAADMGIPEAARTRWRIRIGDTFYMIPWQIFVQPNPPCPRCTVGELHVGDVEILGMVVQ